MVNPNQTPKQAKVWLMSILDESIPSNRVREAALAEFRAMPQGDQIRLQQMVNMWRLSESSKSPFFSEAAAPHRGFWE